MAKIGFGSEFKKKSAFDFPKLSLSQGEKARVCVFDDPEIEYVHTLREIITENGKPVMTTVTLPGGRKKDAPDTDFKGKYICLGDVEILEKKGVDPDNCPACKASVENGQAVEGPKPRYIVHVLKYQVKKGTFTPQEPFQAEVQAWDFTATRFNTLCDIKDEFGNLNGVDLLLGPCENATYQKYGITAGGSCFWASDPNRKALAIEMIKNQRSEDLTPLMGRRVSATDLRGEVQGVVASWNEAFGIAGEMPDETPASKSFDNDLGALLGGSDPAPAEPISNDAEEESSTSSTDVEDLNDLLSSFNK